MFSHTTIVLPSAPSWIDYLNLAASWFTAIGTVGTVVVTLVLTYQQQAQRLKLYPRSSATITVMPEGWSGPPPIEHFFRLTAFNPGHRAITLRSATLAYQDANGEVEWMYSLEGSGSQITHEQERQYAVSFAQIPDHVWDKLIKPAKKSAGLIWTIESMTGKKWTAPLPKAAISTALMNRVGVDSNADNLSA